MKRSILMLFAITLIIGIANAQTSDKKWSFGVQGGATQYNGDLGNGYYLLNQSYYGFGGLTFSRYLSPHFDLSIQATMGEAGHVENENKFRTALTQANFELRYKIIANEEVKFSPYLFAGLGHMKFEDKYNDHKKTNNTALPAFGAGVTYRVTPVINLQFQETFLYSDYDGIDRDVNANNDGYLLHSIGVVFNFGKAKDTDSDGISDKKDNCPDIKGIIAFYGCPDTDGDGVIDKDDACSNTPSNVKVDAKGCPIDSDGDGVADYVDNCPDVKGLASLNGCPDSDNDGIANKDDACPNTPTKVKVDAKGCPIDIDGDGVADYLDKCPDVKGLTSLNGCPDRDGDGVADKDDKCPDVKGLIENKGCPEVKNEVKEVFKKALQGIQFETGKDVIRKNSFAILDAVVKIMKENPSYILQINGHTDNVGNSASNMTLSQKRAEAVKKYLVDNGIDSNRLKAAGYGDTKPVADNKTASGKAQNRRVEFVVEF